MAMSSVASTSSSLQDATHGAVGASRQSSVTRNSSPLTCVRSSRAFPQAVRLAGPACFAECVRGNGPRPARARPGILETSGGGIRKLRRGDRCIVRARFRPGDQCDVLTERRMLPAFADARGGCGDNHSAHPRASSAVGVGACRCTPRVAHRVCDILELWQCLVCFDRVVHVRPPIEQHADRFPVKLVAAWTAVFPPCRWTVTPRSLKASGCRSAVRSGLNSCRGLLP